MKNVLFFLLFPCFLYGQIDTKESMTPAFVKIGDYKYSDFNRGELNYSISNNDTTIVLCCQDQRYPSSQKLSCIGFKGGAKEVEQLRTALMNFYSEENMSKSNHTLSLQLGDYSTKVSRLGKRIKITTKNGDFVLDKENIISLFGKK